MNEEKAGQNEQFLREAARQLRMAQVEATLETDDLIHTAWNGKPLCTVDANGTVRFSPDDIRSADEDRQHLFSDEQLAVIRNACEFSLEDDITLSCAEEKLLRSVQEQIGQLFPEYEQERQPAMEQTM